MVLVEESTESSGAGRRTVAEVQVRDESAQLGSAVSLSELGLRSRKEAQRRRLLVMNDVTSDSGCRSR